MGYCFGGMGAIEAARGNLNINGVISFHGGLDCENTQLTKSIRAKLLVLHGQDAPIVSKIQVDAFVAEMKAVNSDLQLIVYANTVNSFTDPAVGSDSSKSSPYNPVSAYRSWNQMEVFLKEIFHTY